MASSTILNNGLIGYSRIYPGAEKDNNELDILAETNDDLVRDQAPGFDGMERPFALIPYDDGKGGLDWRRYGLDWSGTDGSRGEWDVYAVSQPPTVDDNEVGIISQNGIALGMDTNVGELWMQNPGQNLIPEFF